MVFLPKMGFNRHMKRDLAFAPRCYGGVGLTHGHARRELKEYVTFSPIFVGRRTSEL